MSKQTIDGVSRELLVELRNVCGDPELAEQVRVLLDTPEHQKLEPDAYLYGLDRLKSPHVSGCAASLNKEPGKGFVAIYTEQPAPVAESTTSDKYKAELYDEVWKKARDMGFANVTDTLEKLAKPVAVFLPGRRELSASNPYLSDADHEYNSALDEVAKLNGINP